MKYYKNMDNEKHERFERIASARTNRVIDDIRLLSNCANKNNYSYSPEEAAQIIKAVEEAVRDLKASFATKPSAKTFSFKK